MAYRYFVDPRITAPHIYRMDGRYHFSVANTQYPKSWDTSRDEELFEKFEERSDIEPITTERARAIAATAGFTVSID